MVFDTETTSLEKPFVYNIGYIIYDLEGGSKLLSRDYVVEQIWHNMELFSSAYYADKREIYVSRLKGRTVKMEKYGYICQQMIRDIKNFDVNCAYAYNAPFDVKVFNFNSDWFKVMNPFELIPVHDILGNVHKAIAFKSDYKAFCTEHELFTDTGNYSATAENVYRYITGNTEFVEEHTALSDSNIELAILLETFKRGCEPDTDYKVYRSIPNTTERHLKIYLDKELQNDYVYIKKINRKSGSEIWLTTTANGELTTKTTAELETE